ncbi:hypothetical protein [Catalinimonas niigatensis]|uniref:hypothetical protein n=1 Tax=Catalinimonas niigatensis TaxID=1397264 RepID=UPI002666541D|nr:hypothetical protein [Catalinimonas niigatensis]WPP49745.1 hypothetical protein PZB72_24030 [Catalinimonas niigatensis]
MKSFKQLFQAYLSQFGSMNMMVWVVALGMIAAYGLLDTYSYQTMGNPYLRPEEYTPSIQQQYSQPLQQPAQQDVPYQPGNQSFPAASSQQPAMQFQQQMNNQMPQAQENRGYPNESGSYYPSSTLNAYPNAQNENYQQKEGLNYGY